MTIISHTLKKKKIGVTLIKLHLLTLILNSFCGFGVIMEANIYYSGKAMSV